MQVTICNFFAAALPFYTYMHSCNYDTTHPFVQQCIQFVREAPPKHRIRIMFARLRQTASPLQKVDTSGWQMCRARGLSAIKTEQTPVKGPGQDCV